MNAIQVRMRLLRINGNHLRSIEGRQRFGSKKAVFTGKDYYSALAAFRTLSVSNSLYEKTTTRIFYALNEFNRKFFSQWTPRLLRGEEEELAPEDRLGKLLEDRPEDRGLRLMEKDGYELLDARSISLAKLKECILVLTLLILDSYRPVASRRVKWCPRKDANRVTLVALRRTIELYCDVRDDGWSVPFLRQREATATRMFLDVLRCHLSDQPETFTWQIRRYIREETRGEEEKKTNFKRRRKKKRSSRKRPRFFDQAYQYLVGVVGWSLLQALEEQTPGITAVYRSAMHDRMVKRNELQFTIVPGNQTLVQKKLVTYLKGDESFKRIVLLTDTYKAPAVLERLEVYRPWIAALVVNYVKTQMKSTVDNTSKKVSFNREKGSSVFKDLVKSMKLLDDLREPFLTVEPILDQAGTGEEELERVIQAIITVTRREATDLWDFLERKITNDFREEEAQYSGSSLEEPFWLSKVEFCNQAGYHYYQKQLCERVFDGFTVAGKIDTN